MAYTVPRVTIAQEFSTAAAAVSAPLAALIIGPNYKLFRYAEASEKALTKAINSNGTSGNNYLNANTLSTDPNYYSASDVLYTYPNVPTNSVVDTTYVKLYLENVEAQYFPNATLGSVDGTTNFGAILGVNASTSVFYKNRLKATTIGIRLKTTAAGARHTSLSNRDVSVGDIIEIWDTDISSGTGNVGTPFKTKIKSLIAATVAASNGSPTADLTVKGVSVTAPGSGYTSAPTVAFSAPNISGGIQATGTADLGGGSTVLGVVITNPGSGYTSNPTITFTGGGGSAAAATGIVTSTTVVSQINITNGGSGYTSAPTVTFTGGSPTTPARATATVSGGVVTSISITQTGVGYAGSVPAVGFTGGGGSSAAATAALGTAPTASITSANTDFVGTSNITYKLTVVRGGLYYDGSTNSATCCRVQVTSNSTDSTAALINVQENTAFSVGTLGVQAKYATSTADGLVLGDVSYIPMTAASAGDVDIIELNDELPSTMLVSANLDVDEDPSTSATGLRFKLKLTKSSLQVSQLRSLVGSQVNFTPTVSDITIKNDITTTDPLLVSAGSTVSLPVTAGSIFIEYRALLKDAATSIASLDFASDVEASLGTIHPDNKLAQGVYDALLNSADTTVYYVGISSNDLTGYNTALGLAKNSDKVYGVVPLTFNSDVQQAIVSHVNALSAKTVGKERTAWLSSQLVTTSLIYNLKSDNTDWVATVIDDPLDSSTRATLVTVAGATFITSGVRIGDSVLINFQLDATGTVIYDTFNIKEVRSETTVVIDTGYLTPITSAIKAQVRRNYTKSEQITNLAAAGSGYNNRRIVSVFPDTYKNGSITKNGYFLAAALAGLASGVAPHQGLTNIEILGATDVSKTFIDFTSDDLDTLADAGYWIVTQDAIGSVPFTRHQLTTDSSSLNMQENSVTRNVDSISKSLRTAMAPYLGKYNINSTNLLLFRSVIEGRLRFFKTGTFTARAGNQLIDYTINSLAQDSTFKDKVVVEISLTLPYPNNNTDITLLI